MDMNGIRAKVPKAAGKGINWSYHLPFGASTQYSHVSLLEPYNRRDGALPELGPDLLDGEEEYQVEAVLKKRKQRNKTQYLVSWLGWGPSGDTWNQRKTYQTPRLSKFFQEQEPERETLRKPTPKCRKR
ncbi:hypothetical protein ACJ73_05068 [Blastomyces percursus]|uniref:Chromo domain-containing protein n=1 Tax=Blastomyces percursus TaxID=1658174 RepID=A0A1J9R6F8_9EURO|nr:hypothetical protein ACJ73_05068 [Blastomyces percursus]